MRFGVSQFIADTERRTCAFCYKDVTSSEPFGILLINLLIDFSCPNLYTKIRFTNMFGKHNIRPVDILYDSLI